MKRLIWMVLLASLGLNLGLGIRLIESGSEGTKAGSDRSDRPDRVGRQGRAGIGGRGGGRPALTDSAAWTDFARHRFERLADRLELRDGQQDRFAEVHHAGAQRVRGQGLKVHAVRLRLHDLYLSDPLEAKAIRSAVAELAAAQARMDSLVAEVLIAELEVLDQVQRARYLDLIPWEQHHGQAGGRAGGPAGGVGRGHGHRSSH